MPRIITTHAINPCNEAIAVEAVDDAGPGGASHVYDVRLPNWQREPSAHAGLGYSVARAFNCTLLNFQNGPVKENGEGVNGLTHEVLLAIILDRMNAFQAGPYKCRENALAITKLEEAVHWLGHRTRAREARGVEGTHAV